MGGMIDESQIQAKIENDKTITGGIRVCRAGEFTSALEHAYERKDLRRIVKLAVAQRTLVKVALVLIIFSMAYKIKTEPTFPVAPISQEELKA